MIENNVIKDKYYSFLKKYTDESKKETNRERRLAVNQFIAFLETQVVNIGQLNSEVMLDFVNYLKNCKSNKNEKYSPYTVQQRFALVSTFLQYCFEHRYLDEHKDRIVTSSVKSKLPPLRRKIKEYISFEEMLKLFNNCMKKNEALLRILYNTACRVSAVADIRVSDFDFKEKTLVFFEKKGNNENIVYLADSTIEAVREYKRNYRKDLRDSTIDYLFVSSHSQKYRTRTIQLIVARETEFVLKKRLTPHRFRDIAITHMLENNANVTDVSLFASHKNIRTTMVYYNQSKEHRERTMKNSHPLLQIENLEYKEEKLKKRENDFENLKQDFLKSMKDIIES